MSFFQGAGWRVKMQDVARSIDDNLGAEELAITPVRGVVNKTAEPIDSETFLCCGRFNWRYEMALNQAGLPVSSRKPEFSIRYEQIAERTIARGYRITRLCTGEVFEVANVKDDGVSRVEYDVVQQGLQHIAGRRQGGVII